MALAGLRLAALFGFLVLLTMLTTLALVYLQVSTVLHRNLERQLQQAQQRLALQYAHEGPQATAQAIGHMLRTGATRIWSWCCSPRPMAASSPEPGRAGAATAGADRRIRAPGGSG